MERIGSRWSGSPARYGVKQVPQQAQGQRDRACGRAAQIWRNTALKALRLSLRKSAMILKLGLNLHNSQIASRLRRASISSRRLERTQLT